MDNLILSGCTPDVELVQTLIHDREIDVVAVLTWPLVHLVIERRGKIRRHEVVHREMIDGGTLHERLVLLLLRYVGVRDLELPIYRLAPLRGRGIHGELIGGAIRQRRISLVFEVEEVLVLG